MNITLCDFLVAHDNYVCEWWHKKKEKTVSCKLEDIFKGGVYGRLDTIHLPSPYLGKPCGCTAVIININPGASSNEEGYKKSRDREENLFAKECGNSYHKFAEAFHFLNPCYQGGDAKDEDGNKWWERRVDWINRIEGVANPEPGKYPFALELCPWHSHGWRGFRKKKEVLKEISLGVSNSGKKSDEIYDLEKSEIRDYIEKQVLIPAVEVAYANNLPCVYAIGKPIYECLVACGCNVENHCDSSSYEAIDASFDWPHRKNKKEEPLVNREFRLLTYCGVKILCTWAPGGNKTPGKAFDKLIRAIVRIPQRT